MAGGTSPAGETPIFAWGYQAEVNSIDAFAIASISIPKCGNKVVEVHTKNRTIVVAGKEEHQQIEVQVRHFVSLKTAAALYAWHVSIIQGDNLSAGGYQKDISISLLAPGGGSGGTIIGKQCWPSMIAFGEAAYDRSEIMLGSLTLEVETVEVQ